MTRKKSRQDTLIDELLEDIEGPRNILGKIGHFLINLQGTPSHNHTGLVPPMSRFKTLKACPGLGFPGER